MKDFLPDANETDLDLQFARALAGELSRTELAALRHTLQARGVELPEGPLPGRPDQLPAMPGIDIPGAWATVQHRLRSADRLSGRHHDAHASTSWRTVMAQAAALLLVAGGIVTAWQWGRHRASAVAFDGRTYATKPGQQATIVLADGSRVRLAPQTTLRLPANFGEASRAVALSGEAYFDVANERHTPFVVHAGDITTRVLGTTFHIQRYPTDTALSVSVLSGKVAVARPGGPWSPMTLTAGMTGVVTDSFAVAQATSDTSNAIPWVNGQLVFHKAPARAVLAALTRWYGYQFRVTDSSLVSAKLTLWLSTESSSAALSTLEQVLNADLTVDHDIVTISPRRSRAVDSTPTNRTHTLTVVHPEVGR